MKKLLQAGAIPFRRVRGDLEFLIITSLKGNWIFPKGIVEPGETPAATARKEVREEAGIAGVIRGESIDSYRDSKWGARCEVVMFLLEHREDLETWEEEGTRERRWCSYAEARELLTRNRLKKILDRAYEALGGPPAGGGGRNHRG